MHLEKNYGFIDMIQHLKQWRLFHEVWQSWATDEFNNIFAAISGHAQTANFGVHELEKFQEKLKKIVALCERGSASAKKLSRLISQ